MYCPTDAGTTTLYTNDKKGINMHNEQWGSLVSKAAGGGFSWCVNNI